MSVMQRDRICNQISLEQVFSSWSLILNPPTYIPVDKLCRNQNMVIIKVISYEERYTETMNPEGDLNTEHLSL
jgi:hypothetical protein